ncbi:MAG TPA: RNA polymerase sigma factor [Pseudonocardiaceae bacterium]|jgi:RNA polymerase sigma-70 factor (ECF subfamily)
MTRTPPDRDEFVAPFWQHGTAVHAYLSRRAGRQDADDLLGEVWLQAFRSRARFDRRWPSALPWLYGIAHNVLRTYWRQHPPTPSPGIPGESHDPWPSIDDRLDVANIRAALARLTEQERDAVLLVAWEQLSPAEAAIACTRSPCCSRPRPTCCRPSGSARAIWPARAARSPHPPSRKRPATPAT